MLAFSDLREATYCPRKLYYARRHDDRSVPDDVEAVRELAHRYDAVLAGGFDDELAELAALPPDTYREQLRHTAATCPRFDALADPADRDVLLTGRDCRGIANKVLADPPSPSPSLVSPGKPPENGVWKPHSVWAVAAAKALAWERETPVERAFVEYPAHGVVRTVDVTARRTAAYRRAMRTVEGIDGPPPRLGNSAKCDACEYADSCGVKTRTLGSLLGL